MEDEIENNFRKIRENLSSLVIFKRKIGTVGQNTI